MGGEDEGAELGDIGDELERLVAEAGELGDDDDDDDDPTNPPTQAANSQLQSPQAAEPGSNLADTPKSKKKRRRRRRAEIAAAKAQLACAITAKAMAAGLKLQGISTECLGWSMYMILLAPCILSYYCLLL